MSKKPEPSFEEYYGEVPEREPNVTVNTGINDGTAASQLHIYYVDGKTIVCTSGEAENAMPYRYDSIELPSDIRRWYRAGVRA